MGRGGGGYEWGGGGGWISVEKGSFGCSGVLLGVYGLLFWEGEGGSQVLGRLCDANANGVLFFFLGLLSFESSRTEMDVKSRWPVFPHPPSPDSK